MATKKPAKKPTKKATPKLVKKPKPAAKPAVPTSTDIVFILDKSGSMASVWAETISGFNQFVDEQCMAPGSAAMTLVQFNNEYTVTYEGAPIGAVPRLTMESYHPSGYTALLDAVGRSVTNMLAKAPKGRVVVVIQTDGLENASREFSKAQVKSLIEKGTELGWQFVFLGANHDAFAEAGSMGISRGSTMAYAGDGAGTKDAIISTSAALTALRSGTAASMSFTDQDYKKQSR